jgi:hypothetical protein
MKINCEFRNGDLTLQYPSHPSLTLVCDKCEARFSILTKGEDEELDTIVARVQAYNDHSHGCKPQ